jgi:hypothetical protein
MEDDDGGMTKVETACEWMYEFCSRHGMEDAMQGRFPVLLNLGGTEPTKREGPTSPELAVSLV